MRQGAAVSHGPHDERGEYSCLHTALTREGALGELEKQRRLHGGAVGGRDLASIDIAHLEPVLDLTEAGDTMVAMEPRET